MIRLLLVEDEAAKRQAILQLLTTRTKLTLDTITVVDNAHDAKVAISSNYFALVILDINIPTRGDVRPEAGAGLEVLRFVRSNAKATPPGYILGLTGYDDSFAAASAEFSCALWKLIRFSFGDSEWESPLIGAVEYLISNSSPPFIADGRTFHTDVAIVTALEEELEAVLRMHPNWDETRVSFDSGTFHTAAVSKGSAGLSVVATSAPRMGLTAMGITATKVIESFRPRLVITTGVCAGVRSKAKIGDILVADPCFDWGSGKWIRDKKSKKVRFLPAHYQWRLPSQIDQTIRRMRRSADTLELAHRDFEGKKPAKPPQVHIDAMASGASVLQVMEFMKSIRDQHKNLIGVDMENYAVFAACEYSRSPRPLCVAVKGVSDYGEEGKSDGYRPYALHVVTSFVKEAMFQLAEDGVLKGTDGSQ